MWGQQRPGDPPWPTLRGPIHRVEPPDRITGLQVFVDEATRVDGAAAQGDQVAEGIS
jgi:hypothetical protein